MAAKLVAEEGALKELVLSFDAGDQWLIGRDPDASQLIVEDLAVSRKQALCRRTSEGIAIENLSQTSPTLVNDEPLTQSRLLVPGDMVKMGSTVFCFYEDTGASVIDESSRPTTAGGNKVPTAEETIEKIAQEQETGTAEQTEEKVHDSIFEENGEASDAKIAEVNFDLTETGRWLLKVVGGPNSGAEFSMQTSNSYILGTDPNSCDIVFYDNTVSRQHVRITVSQDDTLTIEDLKSRNGTRVDGELITGKTVLQPSTFVAIGTTSFVVYDREGQMQTIISPLLPAIVKALNKQENAEKAEEASQAPKEEAAITPAPAPKKTHNLGAFILIWILIGVFAIVGIAVQTLFVQETVVPVEEVDTSKIITEALSMFPAVKFSFNKTTGRLLLVGHVLTATDKNQLLYNLQGLKFIKVIDDSGVIIDEYVWTEANQVLSKNPQWKGVTVHSPGPGRFVLSGYLETRDQAEQVWDYITRNFPYLDLLENKIIVEEDVLSLVVYALRNQGLTAVVPKLAVGELTLTGGVQIGQKATLDALVAQFKEIPGVRMINNQVTERERSEAVINISDKYSVSGSSQIEAGKLNVVINGRILSEGDTLDGMKITHIQPHYILLEKDGTVYRIDFNQ